MTDARELGRATLHHHEGKSALGDVRLGMRCRARRSPALNDDVGLSTDIGLARLRVVSRTHCACTVPSPCGPDFQRTVPRRKSAWIDAQPSMSKL
jgi:hypothetical protein